MVKIRVQHKNPIVRALNALLWETGVGLSGLPSGGIFVSHFLGFIQNRVQRYEKIFKTTRSRYIFCICKFWDCLTPVSSLVLVVFKQNNSDHIDRVDHAWFDSPALENC